MKIKKSKNHVLLSNSKGEYHLSIDKFNQLGQVAAIELATLEIDRKSNSHYTNNTINLSQARDLGFCEYGIEDFCKQLNLDINNTYVISEIFNKITLKLFLDYSAEISKLFGRENILAKFGGVRTMLKNNPTSSMLSFVLRGGFLSDKTLHILACDFADSTLSVFEGAYPNDLRPRKAIEIKRLWIDAEYS